MRLELFFFFSSRRRHTRLQGDWSSDVCSSDLGQGSIAANLTDATAALFGADAQALMNLVAARPELGPAVAHAAPPAGGGGIGDVESHFAAYLDAEKQAGRIAAGTDTQALAFTLIGAIHHLVITNPGGVPDLTSRVRRIVAALIAGTGPAPEQPHSLP